MVGGKNLKERHQNASLIFYRFPRYCILIPKISISFVKNIYKSEWLPPLTNLELNYIFINKIQRFISLIPICKDKGFESEFHRIMELIKLKSIEINPSNSSWED